MRNRLAGAIASSRLPQSLLFEGPRGVGKQRLGLWLAQLLLCEQETASAKQEGCGACRGCRLVLTLQHPDLHWFVPLELNRKGADAEKQIELVEEALAEEMATRREQPLYAPPSGLASHSIASVRLLARRLALTPALGRRKVCIIGDAERLVSQQGAEAAANALLKALEEPPADTVLVLTASEPDALLPTILSRVVRVRVARLADSIVAAFAQRELGLDGQGQVAERVTQAEGVIGKLLALQGARAGDDAAEQFRTAVRGDAVTRYAQALRQQPFQARGGFTEMLDALVARLRSSVHEAPRGDNRKLVEAIGKVLEARDLARGNVNPQLLTAVLADELSGGAQ
jgi:DNA polymerase-3 subunit delta'